MKFNFPKPAAGTQEVAKPETEKSKVIFGKPVKPTESLQEKFESAKQDASKLAEKAKAEVASPLANQTKASPLANLLAQGNKPAQAKTEPKETKIPELAPLTEKYVLDAEATEQLPQTVLDEFASKMQDLIDYMDTQELQTSLHDVLRYAEAHPHLRGIIRAEDVQLIVRAARKSYGLTVTAKTGNKKRAKASDKMLEEIAADLEGLEFTI